MLKFIILAFTVTFINSLTCGFGEFDDSGKCKSCPIHCISCTSSETCFECAENFTLSIEEKSCKRQEINNCIQMDSSKRCQQCASGYWLKNDNTCVESRLEGCLTWLQESETEKCQAVATNYYLDGDTIGKCSQIFPGCYECSSTNCYACQEGYYYAGNNLCKIKTKYCYTWSNTENEVCMSCPIGYEVHEGECYASQCLYSNNNSIKCSNGYARSSTPLCNIACNDVNCEDCMTPDSETCQQCRYGYLLFQGNCYQMKNCLILQSATSCSECQEGYSVVHGECIETMDNCIKLDYNDQTKCIECMEEYSVINYQCVLSSSVQYCKLLDADNTEVCYLCEDGYYAENGICKECTPGCKCSGADNLCTSCLDKRKLFDEINQNCNQQCENNCYTCDGSPNACTSCQPGYMFNQSDNTCGTSCTTNCQECTYENQQNQCTVCSEGYSLTMDKLCLEIYNIIIHCEQMATKTSCGYCLPGYSLYPDKMKCISCPDHCLVCDSQGQSCTECEEGYYVDGSESFQNAICVNCANYSRYVGKICDYTSGWRKFPFQCEAFYGGCAESNPTPIIGEEKLDCKTCKTGYKLDTESKNCVSCPYKCQYCEGSNNCEQCYEGYYLNEQFECVECDSGCQQCDRMECRDCKPYYGFYESTCMSCPNKCIRCDDVKYCIECERGWYINKVLKDDETMEATCQQCADGCQDCDDEMSCYDCVDGYYLENGECLKDEQNEEKKEVTIFQLVCYIFSALLMIAMMMKA